MNYRFSLYIEGQSCIHKLDARIKLAMLIALSVLTLTLPSSVSVLFLVIAVVAGILSKIPFQAFRPYLIMSVLFGGFSLIFNGFSFENPDILLLGSLGLSKQGIVLGLLNMARLMSLMLISCVVCLSTTSENLMKAIRWYVSPIAAKFAFVNDFVLIMSMAIRFLPLIVVEVQSISAAQTARASYLQTGSFMQRVTAWTQVFIPLVVRLFLYAENVGTAMDARCYGASLVGPVDANSREKLQSK